MAALPAEVRLNILALALASARRDAERARKELEELRQEYIEDMSYVAALCQGDSGPRGGLAWRLVRENAARTLAIIDPEGALEEAQEASGEQ